VNRRSAKLNLWLKWINPKSWGGNIYIDSLCSGRLTVDVKVVDQLLAYNPVQVSKYFCFKKNCSPEIPIDPFFKT
jgi:hypothetical protein